jgi:hypothetical protein
LNAAFQAFYKDFSPLSTVIMVESFFTLLKLSVAVRGE